MNEADYFQHKISREQHLGDMVHESVLGAAMEAQEMNLFTMLKPKFGIDGNQWYVLYGEDLQSGVAGFGDTLMLAIYDFNKAFHKPVLSPSLVKETDKK